MNNKLIIVLITILLALNTFACPDAQSCNAQFEQEPTAENLRLIENPTVANFDQLSDENKLKYISSLSNYELAQDNTKVIAYTYFSEDIDNVNDNPTLYGRFLESQGIQAVVKGEKLNLKRFGKDGVLKSGNQQININNFNPQGKLYRKFGLLITQEGIFLIPKGVKNPVSFEGEITASPDGDLNLKEGKINEIEIKNGQGIKINQQGNKQIIQGKFSYYSGIEFSEPTQIKSHSDGENVFVNLRNAKITSIEDVGIKLHLAGDVNAISDVKTVFYVAKKTKLRIKNDVIKANKKPVKIEFKDKPISYDSPNNIITGKKYREISEPTVIFYSDAVDIRGKNKDFIFERSGYAFSSKPKITLRKPSYKLGDKGKDVQTINKMLKHFGHLSSLPNDPEVFSKETQEALKLWQAKRGIINDGIFESKALISYYGFDPRATIAISPNGGRVVLSSQNKFADIQIQGNNEIKVGYQLLKSEDNKIKRVVRKSHERRLDIPVKIQVQGTGGKLNIHDEYFRDSPNNLPSDKVLALKLDNKKYTGIVVDKSTQEIYYYEDGHIINKFIVGIGTGNDPKGDTKKHSTASGDYTIGKLEINKPSRKWAKDPILSKLGLKAKEGYYDSLRGRLLNVYGPGYLSLKDKNGHRRDFGIHGTNIAGIGQLWTYSKIGKGRFVSHGCIRMYDDEWFKIRDRVKPGTKVKII